MLESSVFAFKRTIEQLLKIRISFLKTLEFIPAGEEAAELRYDAESYEAIYEFQIKSIISSFTYSIKSSLVALLKIVTTPFLVTPTTEP